MLPCLAEYLTLPGDPGQLLAQPGQFGAFVDAEGQFNRDYAAALGINLNLLILIERSEPTAPDEEIIEGMYKALGNPDVGPIVLDSIAALRAPDSKIGNHSRMLGTMLRDEATPLLKASGNILLGLNQQRKGGIGSGMSYTTTTGGNAPKFYASQRVKVSRAKDGMITTVAGPIGHTVEFYTAKNRQMPGPYQKGKADLIYGRGFDPAAEAINAGLKAKILHRKGAWISYREERLGQGFAKSLTKLHECPELRERIEAEAAEGWA